MTSASVSRKPLENRTYNRKNRNRRPHRKFGASDSGQKNPGQGFAAPFEPKEPAHHEESSED
jgi:hypothetical protein